MTVHTIQSARGTGGRGVHARLDQWLPNRTQMVNAVQLRFDLPPDPTDETAVIPRDSVLYASMRQGMGMIIAAALLAGLLPFLWNWFVAGRSGYGGSAGRAGSGPNDAIARVGAETRLACKPS